MKKREEKYWNENLDVEERLDDLFRRLTLDEKFQLCSGRTLFSTRGVKRLGIPPFNVTDGPVGVAFHSSLKRNTYFPATIGLAASWNTQLSEAFGDAIARETRASGNSMILGPGINICRTPLNGRTFEYLGEDPYQNSRLVVPIVKAIQKRKIAACVKHYAANNQETRRFSVDVQVSKRALEEIYLPAFKASVEEADAWSIMACYNRLNGLHGCEHKELLVDRLVDQYGFRGFVVSDWFAANKTKSTGACVEGGLALDMPGKIPPIPKMEYRFQPKKMRSSFNRGEFTEASLDRNLRGYLRCMFLTGVFDDPQNHPKGERNTPENRCVARKIAEESMVLLKNDNNILPLDINKVKTIAVVGPNKNRKTAWLAYGGSSAVWPEYEVTALKGLATKGKGQYQIIKSVKDADVAIVVAGLSHGIGGDSEGFDRKKLELPEKQIELIKATCKQNKNTIVVLVSGSAVTMDAWLDETPALIEAWYAGMEGGHALADIIFGDVNPSGKLPISFPKKLSDSPAHKSRETFPGKDKVFYDEGIYVGYRHFDKQDIEPLFPFGFGLSYTEFEYSNIILNRNTVTNDDVLVVNVDIKNIGNREGAEVVQLYLRDTESSVDRPLKELKGFRKINLKSGEKQTISFLIENKDLEFFDEEKDSWRSEAGMFEVLIGASSRDILLKTEFELL